MSSNVKLAMAIATILCVGGVCYVAMNPSVGDDRYEVSDDSTEHSTKVAESVEPSQSSEDRIVSNEFSAESASQMTSDSDASELQDEPIITAHSLKELKPNQRQLYSFIAAVTGAPWHDAHRKAMLAGTEGELEAIWNDIKGDYIQVARSVSSAKSKVLKDRLASGKFESYLMKPVKESNGKRGFKTHPGDIAKRSDNEIVMQSVAWNPDVRSDVTRVVRINPGENPWFDEVSRNFDQLKSMASSRFEEVLNRR